MPTDPRKRQKKVERREARRKQKRESLAHSKPTGLAERFAAAANGPILHSSATTDLWDQGLGWVLLSRQLPGGSVAFAVFLVDRYCLGVKDAMYKIVSRLEYESQILRKMYSQFSSRDLTPADVRKIVESSAAYAESLGFSPHPDYFKAKPIFGDINAAESTLELEFGKDGKPFFVAGPSDTPARCRQIQRTLTDRCGVGGFHFMMPVTPDMDIIPVDGDWEEDEDEDE